MYEYYRNDNLTEYLLTVMNMVSVSIKILKILEVSIHICHLISVGVALYLPSVALFCLALSLPRLISFRLVISRNPRDVTFRLVLSPLLMSHLLSSRFITSHLVTSRLSFRLAKYRHIASCNVPSCPTSHPVLFLQVFFNISHLVTSRQVSSCYFSSRLVTSRFVSSCLAFEFPCLFCFFFVSCGVSTSCFGYRLHSLDTEARPIYQTGFVVLVLQVNKVFRDPSIGAAINIVLVRLIILQTDQVSRF